MSNPLKLTLEALAGHDPSELEAAPFVVEDHKVRLDCRLKLHPGADRLFIMLNGAVDRKKTPLPVFARWNWGRVLGGHVLAVCDPTLYLDEELNIGWFVGRRHWNPLDALLRTVATADSVCRTFALFSWGMTAMPTPVATSAMITTTIMISIRVMP